MPKIIIDIPDDFTYTAGDTREDGLIKAVLDYYSYSCIWGFDKMENHIRVKEEE